jgi:hypothetical protein
MYTALRYDKLDEYEKFFKTYFNIYKEEQADFGISKDFY